MRPLDKFVSPRLKNLPEMMTGRNLLSLLMGVLLTLTQSSYRNPPGMAVVFEVRNRYDKELPGAVVKLTDPETKESHTLKYASAHHGFMLEEGVMTSSHLLVVTHPGCAKYELMIYLERNMGVFKVVMGRTGDHYGILKGQLVPYNAVPWSVIVNGDLKDLDSLEHGKVVPLRYVGIDNKGDVIHRSCQATPYQKTPEGLRMLLKEIRDRGIDAGPELVLGDPTDNGYKFGLLNKIRVTSGWSNRSLSEYDSLIVAETHARRNDSKSNADASYYDCDNETGLELLDKLVAIQAKAGGRIKVSMMGYPVVMTYRRPIGHD